MLRLNLKACDCPIPLRGLWHLEYRIYRDVTVRPARIAMSVILRSDEWRVFFVPGYGNFPEPTQKIPRKIFRGRRRL